MKTPRQQLIIKLALEFLNERDGGLITEALIHGAVNLQLDPKASVPEMDDALQFCHQEQWADSVVSTFKGRRWAINDKGRLALAQM